MSSTKELIIDLVKELPEEKLCYIAAYAQFIKNQDLPTLILEDEDEKEIKEILKEDEWFSSEEINKIVGELPE